MKPSFPESATQCLEVDHRDLDAQLLEFERVASNGESSEARKRFAAFASGLINHIDAEEGILLPELEEMEPGAVGPISVMRAEHEELRALLEQIAAHLSSATTGWQAAVRRLKETLLTHNTKEERMLYPMSDAAARGAGRSDTLAGRLLAALSVHAGDR